MADVMLGGLPDVAELRRRADEKDMEAAQKRAETLTMVAYPVSGRQDIYAVPSGSEIGWVQLVELDWMSGQLRSCTCTRWRRFDRWCTHGGAARNMWTTLKEQEDQEYAQRAIEEIAHGTDSTEA